jgi:DNA polymerase-1
LGNRSRARRLRPRDRGRRRCPLGTRSRPGLFDAAPSAEPRQVEGDYKGICTEKELRELAEKLRTAPVISIDTETTSLSPRDAKLCGISVSIEPGMGYYIPIRSPSAREHLDEAAVLRVLRPILEDASRPKCGHNIKFDLLVLRAAGVELRGLCAPPGFDDEWQGADTMVSSYLIDSSRSSHSKDALCLALLNRTNIPITELIGSGKNQRCFDTVPVSQAVPYAAEDADVTLRLRGVMMPQLRAMGLLKLWDEVELPLVEVLAELEWNGIRVDPAELDHQRQRLEGRIRSLDRRSTGRRWRQSGARSIRTRPGSWRGRYSTRPSDPAEPGLGLKSLKKTKTGHSTDIEVLERLAGRSRSDDADSWADRGVPAAHEARRHLPRSAQGCDQQADGTDPQQFLPDRGRDGPPGQQRSEPPEHPIRTDIGPRHPQGVRSTAGSGPDLRRLLADRAATLGAPLARPGLDRGLRERGGDIHTAGRGPDPSRATGPGHERAAQWCQDGELRIVYGITAFGLARRLKIGEKEAAEIITGYKKRFSGITTFLQECVEQAKRYGYVETMLKRRRPIQGLTPGTRPSGRWRNAWRLTAWCRARPRT